MKTINKVTDVSRRKLLKKAYVAPIVIALGSLTISSDLSAMSHRQGIGGNSSGGDTSGEGHHGGAHHGSSSSSLSGGSGWCSVCKHDFPCTHHP